MEFRIDLGALPADDARLAALLAELDPSATSHFDSGSGTWRLNTVLHSDDLLVLLAGAGCAIAPRQVTTLPSVCCGGCSG